jgi:hypothetical protein
VSVDAAQRKPAPRRRWARIAGAIAVLLLLLALALRIALQPEHVTRLVLEQVGKALGLEITASGLGEYQLRGTPRLVVRDVVAREPGAKTPILRAERVLLSVPWSTIRSRGATLDISRVELDAPMLDVAAFQHWLATRPPGESRIPTLSDGLYVTRGRIDSNAASAGGWRVDSIAATLPELHPDRPVHAQVRGRYLDPPTSIPFDLSLALSKPANGAGAAIVGSITIDRGSWRMPARIHLSGPVRLDDGELRVRPARLKMSARYQSGDTDLPFALGLTGPLHFDDAIWTLAPVGVALRGQDLLPSFDARGAFALGQRLVVRLDGSLPLWPEQWPALPVPIGQSTSALPFALDYVGKPDLSDVAGLRLQRDQTRFDGRFRLYDMLAWIDAPANASPLPPLSGHLTSPRLEISGAQLEGVEVTLEDGSLDDPALAEDIVR